MISFMVGLPLLCAVLLIFYGIGRLAFKFARTRIYTREDHFVAGIVGMIFVFAPMLVIMISYLIGHAILTATN